MNKKERLEQRTKERTKYWAEKRPNWLKEPVAILDSPLKFIAEKAVRREQNAKGEWVQRMEPFYYQAAEFARNGQGHEVRDIARALLAKG